MKEEELLLIPGPVTVPKDVLEKMGSQMFNHRGPEYAVLLKDVSEGIAFMLGTKSEVHPVTGSGTAGLEFALSNCIHPNDSVLCLSSGVFGERLADIAKIYGKNVKLIEKPYGQGITSEDAKAGLEAGDYDVVTCVFNESSTGVKNPVKEIAKAVKSSGAMFLVDNISGLGMDYQMDGWGIDITITATQKALGVPPGLAFGALSERAVEKAKKAPARSYYFDYETFKSFREKGQPPFTPCISAMVATSYAVSKIRKVGLSNFNSLHTRRATAVRGAAQAFGMKLFAQDGFRSDTLTAVEHPKSAELQKHLRERHRIIIGGGQRHLNGKIFRIGNMGDVKRQDFERTFNAISEFLGTVGERKELGGMLKALEGL